MGNGPAASVQRDDRRPARRTDGAHQRGVQHRAFRLRDMHMLGRHAGVREEGEQGEERGHGAPATALAAP